MKNFTIKRAFSVLLVIAMIVTSLSIQGETAYAASKTVKSVSLKIGSKNVTKKTFKMTKGKSKKLKVSVKPMSSKKSVTYQSKNKKVVTVSRKGKLTAKNVGTAKIIVKVKGKKGKSKQTWVKVKVTKKKKQASADDNNANADQDNNTPNTDTSVIPNEPGEIRNPELENNTTSYTVTFDLNYESAGVYKTVSVVHGQKVVKPEDPVRKGSGTFEVYNLRYWSIDSAGEKQFDFDTAITSNVILYAQWDLLHTGSPVVPPSGDGGSWSGGFNTPVTTTYSVKFYMNDGTDVVYKEEKVTSGSAINAPQSPVREGYEFKGWYTDSTLDKEYNFDSPVTKTFDLYAKWQKNSEETVKPTFSDKEHEIVNIAELNDGEIPYSNADENGVPNFIDGTFSAKKVTNADDAIEALNDIHHIMQFSDVKQEFEEIYSEKVNLGEATNYYRLQQTYHDIPVYGYQMIVSTDSDGTIQTLSGHYYPNIDIDVTPTLSANDAKDIINDTNKIVSDELCIYTEDNAILCWKIETFTKSYFVNAINGEIVATISEIIDESTTGTGINLADTEVSFPVEKLSDDYYLYDNLRAIRVTDANHQDNNVIPVKENTNNNWSAHKEAITVYTNMEQIYDYYANVFGRNGADDAHREIYIIVNYRDSDKNSLDANGEFANAFFSASLQPTPGITTTSIVIGDGNNYAGALDVLAHEFTHAVTNSIWSGIYRGESGALNEAYSDIIGNLFEDKELYLHGEDLALGANRNFKDPSQPQNPKAPKQPSHYDNKYTGTEDHGGVHQNSGIINHAAYLMDQNWPVTNHADELATLFYKSMYYLSPDSTFIDCRHAVLAAAKSMNMSNTKREIIANAFQEVGVYHDDEEAWASAHHIIGTVKDAETNNPIIDAQVIAVATKGLGGGVGYTNGTGNYDVKVNRARYTVSVFAEGYHSAKIENVDLTSWFDMNKYMENIYLTPRSWEDEQNVFASGKVTNALTGEPLENVTIKFRNNSDNTSGEYIQIVPGLDLELLTDSSGQYYTAALPAGNYTLEAVKDGFITAYKNIVSGNSSNCSDQNLEFSPKLTEGEFRIVLTWDANPRDLDSHVVGMISNREPFHVYYGHKSQYDDDINICNLDRDDTDGNGTETVTLNLISNEPYYYYVYHYAGNGAIASSGAQVKVYSGDRLVGTYNAPTDQGNGRYWNVFAMVGGKIITRNTILSYKETDYIEYSEDSTNSIIDYIVGQNESKDKSFNENFPLKDNESFINFEDDKIEK